MTRNRPHRPTPRTVPIPVETAADLMAFDPLGVLTRTEPQPFDPEHDALDRALLDVDEATGGNRDWNDRPVLTMDDPSRLAVR